ncbi:cell wall-binding repeat-containing protein [Schaalia sp. 19OD2882]|uniref:cell wall-binding repeat-containing protein n=1 Tax=Schaalia sp. 19OD2882 TaxID=2794089 RepID=UPI001C1EC1D7|nr:cell wall-binding repeat-containing protein [Schaalia sp. 19OD2882]QWW19414.1 cell wall-binding repeat-containing protein [Schaalia sp. 19OD2882]
MHTPRRRGRALVTSLLCLALLGAAAPAALADTPEEAPGHGAPAAVALPDTLQVTGVITITRADPATDPSQEGVVEVSLTTPEGLVLPLEVGEEVIDASGVQAAVTVSVPDAVKDEAAAPTQDTTGDAGPSAGDSSSEGASADPQVEALARAALVTETALPTVEITPTQESSTTRAAAQASTHTFDVIYLTSPTGAAPDRSAIDRLVGNLGSYYKAETAGKIAAATVGNYRSEPMPASSDQVNYCLNPAQRWQWAAGRFGQTMDHYRRTPSTHLLVIQQNGACPSFTAEGLADWSAAATSDSGGAIWLADRGGNHGAIEHNRVFLHEFGHNISLGHSGTLDCTTATVPYLDTRAFTEGSGDVSTPTNPDCRQAPYGDRADSMGFPLNPISADGQPLSTPTSLNSIHRKRLGAIPAATIRRVTRSGGAVQDIDLVPSTSTSSTATRLVEVVHPDTGKVYSVEYRAGQDRDARAVYAVPSIAAGISEAPGVRVLREVEHYHDVVTLRRPALAGEVPGNYPWLATNSTFTALDGAFTVTPTAQSLTGARVRIAFAANPAEAPAAAEPPAPADPLNPAADIKRLWGTDRVATAIALAGEAPASPEVILATGRDFPDALAAGGLASAMLAPLYLTTSTGALEPAVLQALQAREARRVTIVGGTGAVPASVEASLTKAGFKVRRIAGGDRFQTAANISREAMVSGPGVDRVFVVNGMSYPDGLAAGAVSDVARSVVVLTNGTSMPAATRTFLTKDRGQRILAVAGGLANTATRSAGFAPQETYVGQTRYETAKLVASRFLADSSRVVVASGTNFPDALSGGALAAVNTGVLVLTRPETLSPEARAVLTHKDAPRTVRIAGGTSAVSSAVETAIRRALN